jgi:rubrerythrin
MKNKDQQLLESAYLKIYLKENLDLNRLAAISDEALDNVYHYGRSNPGNSFGWQANLKSAEFAANAINKGVTDIEVISDEIHKGWNETAKKFVENPDQFDDRKNQILKRQQKEPNKSLEKIQKEVDALIEQQRATRSELTKKNYSQLTEDEKEKDRVVARSLLKALSQDK